MNKLPSPQKLSKITKVNVKFLQRVLTNFLLQQTFCFNKIPRLCVPQKYCHILIKANQTFATQVEDQSHVCQEKKQFTSQQFQ